MLNNETAEERAKRIGVPFIKLLTPQQCGPNPVVAVCGGCGRDVFRIDGYSCPQNNCPIRGRATFYTTYANGEGVG